MQDPLCVYHLLELAQDWSFFGLRSFQKKRGGTDQTFVLPVVCFVYSSTGATAVYISRFQS